jgi:hypothetical protein
MNHAIKATAHEIKIRRVAYFYSAAERRSRGALWPSFAPALIAWAGVILENVYFPSSLLLRRFENVSNRQDYP